MNKRLKTPFINPQLPGPFGTQRDFDVELYSSRRPTRLRDYLDASEYRPCRFRLSQLVSRQPHGNQQKSGR